MICNSYFLNDFKNKDFSVVKAKSSMYLDEKAQKVIHF